MLARAPGGALQLLRPSLTALGADVDVVFWGQAPDETSEVYAVTSASAGRLFGSPTRLTTGSGNHAVHPLPGHSTARTAARRLVRPRRARHRPRSSTPPAECRRDRPSLQNEARAQGHAGPRPGGGGPGPDELLGRPRHPAESAIRSGATVVHPGQGRLHEPDGEPAARCLRHELGRLLSSARITTIGASNVNNGDPTWNADGTKISFGSDRVGNGLLNIFKMNPDGSIELAPSNAASPPTRERRRRPRLQTWAEAESEKKRRGPVGPLLGVSRLALASRRGTSRRTGGCATGPAGCHTPCW